MAAIGREAGGGRDAQGAGCSGGCGEPWLSGQEHLQLKQEALGSIPAAALGFFSLSAGLY